MTEANRAAETNQAVAPAGTAAFTLALGTTGRVVPEPWVNSAAACVYLGISLSTLRRWIRDGRMTPPHRTPTGELRFRLTSLDAVLHSA